jgi:hypothetical protein
MGKQSHYGRIYGKELFQNLLILISFPLLETGRFHFRKQPVCLAFTHASTYPCLSKFFSNTMICYSKWRSAISQMRETLGLTYGEMASTALKKHIES